MTMTIMTNNYSVDFPGAHGNSLLNRTVYIYSKFSISSFLVPRILGMHILAMAFSRCHFLPAHFHAAILTLPFSRCHSHAAIPTLRIRTMGFTVTTY